MDSILKWYEATQDAIAGRARAIDTSVPISEAMAFLRAPFDEAPLDGTFEAQRQLGIALGKLVSAGRLPNKYPEGISSLLFDESLSLKVPAPVFRMPEQPSREILEQAMVYRPSLPDRLVMFIAPSRPLDVAGPHSDDYFMSRSIPWAWGVIDRELPQPFIFCALPNYCESNYFKPCGSVLNAMAWDLAAVYPITESSPDNFSDEYLDLDLDDDCKLDHGVNEAYALGDYRTIEERLI